MKCLFIATLPDPLVSRTSAILSWHSNTSHWNLSVPYLFVSLLCLYYQQRYLQFHTKETTLMLWNLCLSWHIHTNIIFYRNCSVWTWSSPLCCTTTKICTTPNNTSILEGMHLYPNYSSKLNILVVFNLSHS